MDWLVTDHYNKYSLKISSQNSTQSTQNSTGLSTPVLNFELNLSFHPFLQFDLLPHPKLNTRITWTPPYPYGPRNRSHSSAILFHFHSKRCTIDVLPPVKCASHCPRTATTANDTITKIGTTLFENILFLCGHKLHSKIQSGPVQLSKLLINDTLYMRVYFYNWTSLHKSIKLAICQQWQLCD